MTQLDPLAPLRALAHTLLESLIPADCLVCGGWLPWHQHGGVCAPCWESLPWAPRLLIPRRGPLDLLVWAGDYGGDLRRLIHVLKFERFDPLGVPLGRAAARRVGPLIAEAATRGWVPPPAVVVPVPLHWTRRWRRGFNQSLLLARGLAAGLGLPVAPGGLARRHRGRRQMGLGRRDRLVALAGVFRARSSPRRSRRAASLRGRVVLLVDDVATTGATLEACAAELRRAGARAVVGCVIAHTPRGGARAARVDPVASRTARTAF